MDIQGRAREIIAAEAAAISAVQINDSFERAIAALESCLGKIVTTGMGKAGLIARKFAAVLCSTGTPAVFLHPGDAAHGDLGVINNGDCLVAFSTSGKTREVLEMIQQSRSVGLTTIIAMTSHEDSGLRRVTDIVVDMGYVEEPCPLKLTPTSSIAVMAALSDALALVLMERKKITAEDFGLRHHGGYLGQSVRSSSATAPREKSVRL